MKQAICLDGHDLGRFILHIQVTPAPNNLNLPLIMFKSSRKNNFKAGTVKMDDTPVGTFMLLNWPPMPMTSCAEPVAYPSAGSMTSWVNSVSVGMSLTSYLIGALTLAANVLVDKLLAMRDERTKAELAKDKKLSAEAIEEIAKAAKEMRKIPILPGLMTIEDTRAVGLKSVIATASSLASLAFTNDEGSFPLIAGTPFAVEVTRTADGKYGAKASATLTIKRTGQDRLGQDRATKVTGSLAIGANAEGKFESKGEVKAKDSTGLAGGASMKRKSDPEQGTANTKAELSGDYLVAKATGKAEFSSDSKASTTGETDSGSLDTPIYSRTESHSKTRDPSFRTLEEDDKVTSSWTGGPTRETESKTTYPNDPKIDYPYPTQVNTSRIL